MTSSTKFDLRLS